MGIAIHNVSASSGTDEVATSLDLSAAVRQSAGGLLGTTVELSDLVRSFFERISTGKERLKKRSKIRTTCG